MQALADWPSYLPSTQKKAHFFM